MDLLNCVIGLRGPVAPLELCNGLMVPVVFFEQIYAFDRASLIASIPSPAKRTGRSRRRLRNSRARIPQMTDNSRGQLISTVR